GRVLSCRFTGKASDGLLKRAPGAEPAAGGFFLFHLLISAPVSLSNLTVRTWPFWPGNSSNTARTREGTTTGRLSLPPSYTARDSNSVRGLPGGLACASSRRSRKLAVCTV